MSMFPSACFLQVYTPPAAVTIASVFTELCILETFTYLTVYILYNSITSMIETLHVPLTNGYS